MAYEYISALMGGISEGRDSREDEERIRKRLEENSRNRMGSGADDFYRDALRSIDLTYGDEMMELVNERIYSSSRRVKDNFTVVRMFDAEDIRMASAHMQKMIMANPNAKRAYSAGRIAGYDGYNETGQLFDYDPLALEITNGFLYNGRIRNTVVRRSAKNEMPDLNDRERRNVIASWKLFDKLVENSEDPTSE